MQDTNYNVSAISNKTGAVYVNTVTTVYGAGGTASAFVPTVKCVSVQTGTDAEYTYTSITQ